jgi:DNA-binding FadR family transcriptional regulator
MNNELIQQDTVVTQVMEEIKKMICSERYKAGDKIPTEEELAGIFGIGRSSIREAIKIFNYLGILESVTGTGTHVCASANITTHALSWAIILRKKDVVELLELRDVIEHQSLLYLASSCAKNPASISQSLHKLEEILNELNEGTIQKSRQKIIESDLNFHSAIIHGSNNSVFISIWNAIKYYLLDEITQVESLYPADDIVSEHRQILEAICSGDAEKVTKVHRLHLDDIKEKLIKISMMPKESEMANYKDKI